MALRHTTASEAVSAVRSGDRVFVHSVAAAPQALLAALAARAPELRAVEVVQLHTEGPAPYAAPEVAGSFHVNALFVGKNVRDAVARGQGDYVPIFLSEVPARSEEHTSELQSRENLVCRLLLEKKNGRPGGADR